MTCELDGGDLVAYLDGELTGARFEYVEAHVRLCSICQDRLRSLMETTELLRAATPSIDDPVGRARTMVAITHEARRSRYPFWRPPLTVVVTIVALALAIITWPSLPSQAGFHLVALVQRVVPHSATVQDPSTVLNPSRLPGIAVGSPVADQQNTTGIFLVVVVPQLPGGLTLTSFVQVQPDVADLRYLGPRDLHLRLLESPASNAATTVSPSYQRVVISGTEVLWHVNPLAPAISRAVWIRRGVQFELSVVDSSDSGLSLSDARQVVAQLIMAQDRAEP